MFLTVKSDNFLLLLHLPHAPPSGCVLLLEALVDEAADGADVALPVRSQVLTVERVLVADLGHVTAGLTPGLGDLLHVAGLDYVVLGRVQEQHRELEVLRGPEVVIAAQSSESRGRLGRCAHQTWVVY